MTSASELFHGRRSRFGRSSLHELGGGEGDSASSSNFCNNRISHTNTLRRHRHTNHQQSSTARRDLHRLDFDGCDPLPRRPAHLRHRSFLPDRESVLLDQASSHPTSATVNNSDNPRAIQDRLRSNGNDRLPGTVLLARERLLQRLRGVSLSENRQSNRVSPSTRHNDTIVEDDFQYADIGDWESEISRELAGTVPFPYVLTLEKNKRPPGLSQEALKRLQVVIFSKLEKCEEEKLSKGLQDCSICLEGFTEGDKLICLPCGHRFHCHCLDPWVRICGDCPYCRMDILVTGCSAKDRLTFGTRVL